MKQEVEKASEKLGKMLIEIHSVWDLEAFGREVRRRKVLESLYKKLYINRHAEGIELALNPQEILEFVYSRAADAFPT